MDVDHMQPPDEDRWLQMSTASSRLGIVLDCSCPGASTLFRTAPAEMFSYSYCWLLLNHTDQAVSARWDSDIITAKDAGENSLRLREVYGSQEKSLGVWKNGTDLQPLLLRSRVSSTRRRFNLRGAVLKVAAARMNDDYNFTSFEDSVGFAAHDSNMKSFKYIQELCNFESILNITDELAGLSIEDNMGITGMLQKEEFDVAATLSGILPVTFLYVDFLQPIAQFRPVIVFLQPTVPSLRNVFLLPFSHTTWLVLLATVVLSTGVLLTSTMLTRDPGQRWTVSDVSLLMVGIICQQCVPRLPFSVSARTTITLLMLSTMLIWSTYSGGVMSLFSTPDKQIKSVLHLLQFEYTMNIDSYIHHSIYLRSEDTALGELMADAQALDTNDGILSLRKGRHCFCSAAILVEETSKDILSTSELCQMTFFAQNNNIQLAMAVPKKSQFKETLNWGIMKLCETGIKEYFLRFQTIDLPQCPTDVSDLDLTELGPAFLMLGVAFIVSLTILVAELLLNWTSTHLSTTSTLIRNYQRQCCSTRQPLFPIRTSVPATDLWTVP